MEIVTSYIMTAFFTSSMGSLVRIAHENEVKTTRLKKGLLIYVCALSTGYICYEVAVYYGQSWIVGVPSLILALGAVEITRALKNTLGWVVEKILKALPGIVIAAIRRALNLPAEAEKKNDCKEVENENEPEYGPTYPEYNENDYE